MKMNLDAIKTFSFIRNSNFIHIFAVRVCVYVFEYLHARHGL